MVDLSGPHTKVNNLLSSHTAQSLGMIHFAFTSTLEKTAAAQLPQIFEDGMGKIKGITIKLHIDQSVQPITQRHRRIPFHVRKDVEA